MIKVMRKSIILSVVLLLLLTFTAVAQDRVYQLSSHILDINTGKPAPGVKIVLSKLVGENKWNVVEERVTDDNGRVKDFLEKRQNVDNRGVYKLTYCIEPYFRQQSQDTFYPFIDVVFEIKDESHYHVPITLSPYGYSTYRGS